MSTLIVTNPYCRQGDTDCSEIVETLEALGPVERHTLDSALPLDAAIADMGPTLERVVVAGGDGTLNTVLPSVMRAGVPLGVLPLGTANDFARSLGLPVDPVEAAGIIAGRGVRSVDVGVVNGRYFLNAVGIGLGPELTRQMDREKKKRLGVLAYLDSLIQVLGRNRRRIARVTVDGQCRRDTFMQITIANGRHYGGGLLVNEDARMDDGLLHVLCVRPLKPLQLLLRGVRIRRGTVGDDDKLVYRAGREVEVRTWRPCEVTADGELLTRTPVTVRSLPRALAVYVPEESAERIDDAARQSASETPVVYSWAN